MDRILPFDEPAARAFTEIAVARRSTGRTNIRIRRADRIDHTTTPLSPPATPAISKDAAFG
jgi:hypothetical protein